METTVTYMAAPVVVDAPLPVECQVCDYAAGHGAGPCPCQQCYARIQERYRAVALELHALSRQGVTT